MRMALLQQNVLNGGFANLSVNKHYQASRLAVMMVVWWKQEIKYVWSMELYGVPVPLKEWVLIDPHLREETVRSNNRVYNSIMRNWIQCQHVLSPVQSPLDSFLHHPNFQIASSVSNFCGWEQVGLDKLGKMCSGSSLITEAQVIRLLGNFPALSDQYLQIRHFLKELL